MTYRPVNLTALQIGMESGGQQFGKDGKPLTSPKGAVGIAQVMPSTGPEAAELAGLPWDPKRFANDSDYNQRLGDAYQGHLNKIFNGHTLAATAAYNAGPTRVLRLRQQYGDDWAKYLPQETKKYVKGILGVDVGNPGTAGFADGVIKSLGLQPHGEYSVGQPGANESTTGNFPIGVPGDAASSTQAGNEAKDYKSSTARYQDFLTRAIQPIHDNSVAIANKAAAVANTKHSLATDFATREADLEAKIKPLQERRQAILDRLVDLDAMSPLERRLKSAFNSDYDPRVLRGRLDRIENQLEGHEKTYTELNSLRSGVAALSVDADNADIATISAQSQAVLSDAQLLGQVSGAVKTNLDATLLPGQLQVEQLRLHEVAKNTILGNLSVEKVTSLYNQAQASPTGKITVDGMELSVGDLQGAARQAQTQDLSFRSMKAAYAANDMQLANEQESIFIDHMTPEQVTEALKNGGKFNGQQLSLSKLTSAVAANSAQRTEAVDNIVKGTAQGLADSTLRNLTDQIKSTGARAVEMFGNLPGEYSQMVNTTNAQYHAWRSGFDTADKQGPQIRDEYIARTMPQINQLITNFDTATNSIAKKWGGGKPELEAVAGNYLRGNPISGDAALKGLVIISRSGMPAGSKLSGPALQAIQAAQAVVKDWDQPTSQGGESLDAILQGGGKKKETDLLRLVQQTVQNVYANGITDQLMTSLPAIARTVKDPANPTQPHPFAIVNRDDFIAAVRHGDNEGYTKIARDLGLSSPQQAIQMFSQGVDGDTWKAVAKAKGWGPSKYNEVFQQLQSVQMSGTLAALDASHSARPGFSPAKAFVSFLNSEEVQNQVDKVVNGYGRSSFGAYLISSSAGGGYRESWQNYGQSVAAVYTQLHSTALRDRIRQQRGLMGDPYTRMNAVLRAADLTPQESQVLLQATKPLINLNLPVDMGNRVIPGVGMEFGNPNFDAITNVIRNHHFEDKQIEAIRKKAASQWDAMNAVVGRVGDSVNE